MEAKNKNLWVFIETGDDGKAKNVGLELLGPGRMLADKQGGNLAAYDARRHSTLADYIVIATGENGPHLKTLLSAIRLGFKPLGLAGRQSGTPESGWIMADYFDLVIHLFLPATRAYYALDELCREMPTIGGD